MEKPEKTGAEVRFNLDASMTTSLDADTQARLDAMRDRDIDTSDIPDQSSTTDWHFPRRTIANGSAPRALRLDENA